LWPDSWTTSRLRPRLLLPVVLAPGFAPGFCVARIAGVVATDEAAIALLCQSLEGGMPALPIEPAVP